MTTYTTTAATGQTFTFNSKAKTTPAFAIIATTNPDALRGEAQERIDAILANTALGQDEKNFRAARVGRELETDLACPVALFSKHGTRAAAMKALNTARSHGNGHTYEIAPITTA